MLTTIEIAVPDGGQFLLLRAEEPPLLQEGAFPTKKIFFPGDECLALLRDVTFCFPEEEKEDNYKNQHPVLEHGRKTTCFLRREPTFC